MANLNCQLGWTDDHHGKTPLSVSKSVFRRFPLESLSECEFFGLWLETE